VGGNIYIPPLPDLSKFYPDISRFFSGGGEFWINQDYENRSQFRGGIIYVFMGCAQKEQEHDEILTPLPLSKFPYKPHGFPSLLQLPLGSPTLLRSPPSSLLLVSNPLFT